MKTKDEITRELIYCYDFLPKIQGITEDEWGYKGYMDALKWVLDISDDDEEGQEYDEEEQEYVFDD